VNTGSLRLSARVYTTLVVVLAVLRLAVLADARAQITEDPMTTKGPEGAPVTIVEFSDYQ
jgi:hypothetical protein